MSKITNKKFYFVGIGRQYMMVDGKLTNVEVKDRIIDLQSGTAYYVVVLPSGSEVRVNTVGELNTGFYKSEADFENNCWIKAEFAIETVDLFQRISLCIHCVREDDGALVIDPYCWVMKDGEPAEFHVTLNEVNVNDMYRPKLIPSDDVDVYEVPEKYWTSREDTLLWNDYVVKEADGSQHIVKGKLSRLVLTEEQKKLVQKVKDAFKEARDAGVSFAWISDRGEVAAFNYNEVKEGHSEYGHEESSGDFEFDEAMLSKDEFKTGIDCYDFWVNCDEYIDITFKSDEAGSTKQDVTTEP